MSNGYSAMCTNLRLPALAIAYGRASGLNQIRRFALGRIIAIREHRALIARPPAIQAAPL